MLLYSSWLLLQPKSGPSGLGSWRRRGQHVSTAIQGGNVDKSNSLNMNVEQ